MTEKKMLLNRDNFVLYDDGTMQVFVTDDQDALIPATEVLDLYQAMQEIDKTFVQASAQPFMPKNIYYDRIRKINPGLISSKFDYMAETVKFGTWMDLNPARDVQEQTQELEDYVNGEIEKSVEKITEHYRRVGRAQNVYYDEIEIAFTELMNYPQHFDNESAEWAWAEFRKLLENQMAQRSV